MKNHKVKGLSQLSPGSCLSQCIGQIGNGIEDFTCIDRDSRFKVQSGLTIEQ